MKLKNKPAESSWIRQGEREMVRKTQGGRARFVSTGKAGMPWHSLNWQAFAFVRIFTTCTVYLCCYLLSGKQSLLKFHLHTVSANCYHEVIKNHQPSTMSEAKNLEVTAKAWVLEGSLVPTSWYLLQTWLRQSCLVNCFLLLFSVLCTYTTFIYVFVWGTAIN